MKFKLIKLSLQGMETQVLYSLNVCELIALRDSMHKAEAQSKLKRIPDTWTRISQTHHLWAKVQVVIGKGFDLTAWDDYVTDESKHNQTSQCERIEVQVTQSRCLWPQSVLELTAFILKGKCLALNVGLLLSFIVHLTLTCKQDPGPLMRIVVYQITENRTSAYNSTNTQ